MDGLYKNKAYRVVFQHKQTMLTDVLVTVARLYIAAIFMSSAEKTFE